VEITKKQATTVGLMALVLLALLTSMVFQEAISRKAFLIAPVSFPKIKKPRLKKT